MISAVFVIIASTILLLFILFGVGVALDSDTLINICTIAIFSVFGILAVVGVVTGIVSLITGGTP